MLAQVAPPTLTLAKPIAERDLIAEFLADKRSVNTKNAYRKDLRDFFNFSAGHDPTPQLVKEFFGLDRFEAIALVLSYKAGLISRGLSEATINRRLSALKALTNHARKLGQINWDLRDIARERAQTYRDTTGVTPETYKLMMAVPDRSTIIGKRNYAILRLLWDNALRRSEVVNINLCDLNLNTRKIWITGKGQGSYKTEITLTSATCDALRDYFSARSPNKVLDPESPLFVAHDYRCAGKRLAADTIYNVVKKSAKVAGIDKVMSPHRIRHSSITAALDATDGNVRDVQKLSRHKNLNTLLIYDDNRKDVQGSVSDRISNLI